jgi:hypothetical protein
MGLFLIDTVLTFLSFIFSIVNAHRNNSLYQSFLKYSTPFFHTAATCMRLNVWELVYIKSGSDKLLSDRVFKKYLF